MSHRRPDSTRWHKTATVDRRLAQLLDARRGVIHIKHSCSKNLPRACSAQRPALNGEDYQGQAHEPLAWLRSVGGEACSGLGEDRPGGVEVNILGVLGAKEAASVDISEAKVPRSAWTRLSATAAANERSPKTQNTAEEVGYLVGFLCSGSNRAASGHHMCWSNRKAPFCRPSSRGDSSDRRPVSNYTRPPIFLHNVFGPGQSGESTRTPPRVSASGVWSRGVLEKQSPWPHAPPEPSPQMTSQGFAIHPAMPGELPVHWSNQMATRHGLEGSIWHWQARSAACYKPPDSPPFPRSLPLIINGLHISSSQREAVELSSFIFTNREDPT